MTPVPSTGLKCKLCEHGYYLTNGFCLECNVAKGTLSKCEGLCPIDYYIQSLVPDSSNGFQIFIGYAAIFMLVMILWF